MRPLIKGAAVVLAVALVVSSAFYWYGQQTHGPGDEVHNGPLPPVGAMEVPFVLEFEEPQYTPSGPTYLLPVDLEAVVSVDRMDNALSLTPEQLEFLRVNGMVGLSGPSERYLKFFDAYEWIEETVKLPTFITSDSMLDAYHLIFQKVLRDIEDQLLYEQLEFLCRRMVTLSDEQRETLDLDQRHLAEANVVFFAVGLRLLDPDAEVPAYAIEDMETILDLIDDASSWTVPPGFDHIEDFTQYVPRGHYTSSERLTRYFKAMMWYGRMNFRGSDQDQTARAVMASVALMGDEDASSAYLRIYSVVRFIVGAPDDLTPFEYAEVARRVTGEDAPTPASLLEGGTLGEVTEELGKLRKPRILSDIVFPWEETWGMRLFGQAFVYDSYIFQRGVYDVVPDRFMPSAIDVMAVLGSNEAWEREPFGDYDDSFEVNMEALRSEIGTWDDEEWGDSLYNGWLHSLQALHREVPAGDCPAFMGTEAWEAKQLNTQLASWTQLTHDTLLYRKQSYTYSYGIHGLTNFTYVEPVPELYSRLGDMVKATIAGLSALSLLTPEVEEKLGEFEDILECLERVSIAQLTGAEADQGDIDICRKAYEITKWEIPDDEYPPREGEFFEAKTVVVSDVHTDPNSGNCLQEGVGFVNFIIVVVPSEYGLVACVGPVFCHYEFERSLSDGRLNDEQWASMLEDGTAPEPAPWATDFIL